MIYMELNTKVGNKCRAFLPSLNEATKDSVRSWHRNVFPGHFEHGAWRKYGYKPRSVKHQKKKRKMGSPPALVFSGHSKKILNMYMRVTGTKGNVKGKFTSNSTMRYFWMRPENHPNKPAEMKALTNEETQQFVRQIRTGTARRVKAVRESQRHK